MRELGIAIYLQARYQYARSLLPLTWPLRRALIVREWQAERRQGYHQ